MRIRYIDVHSHARPTGRAPNKYLCECNRRPCIPTNHDKKYTTNKRCNAIHIRIGKDKNTITYRTIYYIIRGKIAGVVVQPDNTIIIRGINSIKNNSEPLFVVDGSVVSSIDYIVPGEVKSITVLKDADASIYGSRGSSGVIVIKMKN